MIYDVLLYSIYTFDVILLYFKFFFASFIFVNFYAFYLFYLKSIFEGKFIYLLHILLLWCNIRRNDISLEKWCNVNLM